MFPLLSNFNGSLPRRQPGHTEQAIAGMSMFCLACSRLKQDITSCHFVKGLTCHVSFGFDACIGDGLSIGDAQHLHNATCRQRALKQPAWIYCTLMPCSADEIMTMEIIIRFTAHDELGTCATSLVSPVEM